jgi:hypothetical protein
MDFNVNQLSFVGGAKEASSGNGIFVAAGQGEDSSIPF